MGNSAITRLWESNEPSEVTPNYGDGEVEDSKGKGDESSSTGSLEYK